MKKRKFGLFGWFGSGNLGDDIQPLAIVQALGVDHSYTIYCQDNSFYTGLGTTVKTVGIRYRSLSSLALPCSGDYDILIFGGGGLIAEYGYNSPIAWLLTRGNTYNMLRLLFLLLKGKKIVVFGVGAYHVKSIIGRFLVPLVLNRTSLITVRDAASKVNLKCLGVSGEIHLAADPVFLYNPPDRPGQPVKRVIVNVRTGCEYESRPGGTDLLVRNIKVFSAICDYIISEYDYDILFIPFEPDKKDDLEIIAQIMDGMPSRERTDTHVPRDFDETLNLFATSAFSICMRQHAIISSMITDTPVIGVSYSPKIDEIYNYLDAGKYMIDAETMSFDALKLMVDEFFVRDKRKEFKVFHERMCARARVSVDLLNELAEKNGL